MPKRILFVGESVTLAHVTRLLVLADSLDPTAYDIHFACDPRHHRFIQDRPYQVHTLNSMSSEQFMDALAKGARLYEKSTLEGYIEEDRALLESLRPDVVVGDFRHSLAVSAPLAKVHYANLVNAYWSPYSVAPVPAPDIEVGKILGEKLTQQLFDLAHPGAFWYFAKPLNELRAEHGLPDLGDIRAVNTFGDETLFADLPTLAPTEGAPDTNHYIGPVIWSPDIPFPDWWEEVPTDLPIVYVSLGSSGRIELLQPMLDTLGKMPVTVIVSTAGRATIEQPSFNTYVADYLPGSAAAAKADVVVCNGGSPTVYQALAEGTPVVGIPSNLDQMLNLQRVMSLGAGLWVRSSQADGETVGALVQHVLDNPWCTDAAVSLQKEMGNWSATDRFQRWLEHGKP